MTDDRPGDPEQPDGSVAPPVTGDREIDDAMDDVKQLEDLPVADHHDALSPAHDQLQQALRRDHSTPTDGAG